MLIAREIELCECQFVTIVIDIVHNSAISVRRKGLIGSMEYFRLISADSTLSFRFSTSVTMNGILIPQSRERAGNGAVLKSGKPLFELSPLCPCIESFRSGRLSRPKRDFNAAFWRLS
jgi:hypothetical protein